MLWVGYVFLISFFTYIYLFNKTLLFGSKTYMVLPIIKHTDKQNTDNKLAKK